jgi:carbon starvation protein
MVSIACGAISGWHSLVSTSGSATQLDVETDALPVAGGAMLTEGLLALASLSAFMVVSTEYLQTIKFAKAAALIEGATILVAPFTGGAAASIWISSFYAVWLELYAFTIELLVIRFFWMALHDVLSPWEPLQVILGNKYVSAFIVLLVGFIFAYSGAWINLWLLFGGSNQLLAGLALTLASVYLAKVKRPTIYTFAPAMFMIFTCEAALLYEGAKFIYVVLQGSFIAKGAVAQNPALAQTLNIIFGLVGFILFILGAIVAYDSIKRYREYKKAE